MSSEKETNLGEPFENPLGAEHMGGSSHEEANMEGCLPHGSSVLHVPAVLSEPLRVRLLGVRPYQPSQQLAVLELEVECLVTEGLQSEREI